MENLNIKNSISETTNTSDTKKKIAVLGVGNVGGKVIQNIMNKNFNEVDLILLDSELQELNLSEAPKKIQLGKKLLKGLGAGVNPELGRYSVIESYDEIKNALKDMDIVFVVAGLGGGTGTGASNEIVKIAKENHCLVVSFVSTPFSWEGKKRLNIAKEGLKKLEEVSDHVIVFSNDTIFEDAQLDDIGMKEVFKIMENILYQAIRNVYSNYIKNHKKGEKMLPLIIGGVALAATGYGVRMLMEDEPCICLEPSKGEEEKERKRKEKEENKNKKRSKVLVMYDNKLEEFYKTKIRKLHSTLEKIDSLDFEYKEREFKNREENFIMLLDLNSKKYASVNLSKKDVKKVKKYMKILKDFEEYFDLELEELSKLLEKSNDYESYSKSEKNFIQKLLYLNNVIENILDTNVLEMKDKDFMKLQTAMT